MVWDGAGKHEHIWESGSLWSHLTVQPHRASQVPPRLWPHPPPSVESGRVQCDQMALQVAWCFQGARQMGTRGMTGRHLDIWNAKQTHFIPYSRKLSREQTFVNCWKIRFSQRKLRWIARFCRAKWCHAPNFAEKTFTIAAKLRNLWKFSPSKVIRYTVASMWVILAIL